MVIMMETDDVTTSMSPQIRELLLRAWRERWSEIDFGRRLRRILPRGVSGDVYDLADCVLRQAISGPVTNRLMMSYLNHCLHTQMVSFGATVLAITKITDLKPQCVSWLLGFLLKYKYVPLPCPGRTLTSPSLPLQGAERHATATRRNVWHFVVRWCRCCTGSTG